MNNTAKIIVLIILVTITGHLLYSAAAEKTLKTEMILYIEFAQQQIDKWIKDLKTPSVDVPSITRQMSGLIEGLQKMIIKPALKISDLPNEMKQEINKYAAQPLINYLREHYSFTLDPNYQENSIFSNRYGRNLITAREDSIARMWNAQTNEPLTGVKIYTLTGHVGPVLDAQFSPDGKQIVTASADHSAHIRNIQTGRIVQVLQGRRNRAAHTSCLNSAQFSPDGTKIVTASSDFTAIIWKAKDGTILHTLAKHAGPVLNAQFSPDGKQIVTASSDTTAIIWNAQNGIMVQRIQHRYEYQNKPMRTAQFNPQGTYIVTANNDKTATIWNAQNSDVLHIFTGHTKPVNSAAFSPDGKKIVTASADKTIKIWDALTGNLLRTLTGHTDIVNSAAFSPNGNLIISASNDNTAKTWDAHTGKLLHTLTGHTDLVYNARFSPNGTLIVTASHDETVKIWVTPQQTEQFIQWIENNATLDQISFIASKLGVPGAAPDKFKKDRINILFDDQQTGFTQTMSPKNFEFLTYILGIKKPA